MASQRDQLKQAFWKLVRPLHRPLTGALRRRLGRNYADHPEMELPPPYEAIQLDVERHLHHYLHVSPGDISQVVLVGAHEAHEVDRMARLYPGSRFLCFEPNPGTYQTLLGRFAGHPSVRLSPLALGRTPGRTRFFELSESGNGSLLEPDPAAWARAHQQGSPDTTSFDVTVSTLDRETADLPVINLLWLDVQGAEGDVLAGGADTLRRTQAVFIEVALVSSPYKGAHLFPAIKGELETCGFMCVGLGVDAWNGTGNAFFVRDFAALTRPA